MKSHNSTEDNCGKAEPILSHNPLIPQETLEQKYALKSKSFPEMKELKV